MNKLLLMLSILLTVISYFALGIIYIIYKNKKTKETSAECVIRLTNKDNSIHLVETKNYLSKYQLKRKIIKLTEKTYSNKDIFSNSIAYLFSGYSMIKNKYLDRISSLIPYYFLVTITPIIGVLISILSNSMADAKIGIVLLAIIGIYQYILYGISVDAVNETKAVGDIRKVLNYYIKLNNYFFIITLIEIIRLGTILLQI